MRAGRQRSREEIEGGREVVRGGWEGRRRKVVRRMERKDGRGSEEEDGEK